MDCNNKATLLLTGPGRSVKLCAKDLSPCIVKLQSASLHPGLLPRRRCRPTKVQGLEAYSYLSMMCEGESPHPGMDSDLEAFSHYPADGSFAALPGRTAAKTNYLNQQFLTYYVELP